MSPACLSRSLRAVYQTKVIGVPLLFVYHVLDIPLSLPQVSQVVCLTFTTDRWFFDILEVSLTRVGSKYTLWVIG